MVHEVHHRHPASSSWLLADRILKSDGDSNRVLEASNNIELAGNDESASIKKEIDLVIKHQVANLKREIRLAPKVSEHLEKRLLETEHRTYLWLHLLWNIVRKNLSGTNFEIDRLIDDLPDDIKGSYEVPSSEVS